VALSGEQLAQVDLPESLREAVAAARRIRSREGLRRQLQFIGRLMRAGDPEPIRAQLEAWSGRSRAATAAHHRIERWREQLLADDAAFTAFARERPHADLQGLRTCVRAARDERLAGKPPRHFRALFRLIRDALSGGDRGPSDEPPSI